MARAVLLVSTLFLLLLQMEAYTGDSFKATSLFAIAANSTCGRDPPTTAAFFYRGEIFNCTTGDHPPLFALDSDPSTWWQSDNGADPVSLSFSLDELEVIINLGCGSRYHLLHIGA